MAIPQPACGHCNYPVQGLPTFICPECGSDIRKVGIRLPYELRSSGITGPFAACALLAFLPAFMIMVILSGLFSHEGCNLQYDYMPLNGSSVGGMQKLVLAASADHLQWNMAHYRPVDNITLQIFVAGHPPALLGLDGNRSFFTGATTKRTFDVSAAFDWLGAAGMDVNAIKTQQLAGGIVAAVSDMQIDRFRSDAFPGWIHISSGGGSSYSQDIPWLVCFPLIVGPVLFLLLAWRVWKYRNNHIHSLPVCAFCHFPADQMTTLFCPQCNHDVRIHGIEVGRIHLFSGVIKPLGFCTAFIVIAGNVAENYVQKMAWITDSAVPHRTVNIQWIIWLLIWLIATWLILRHAQKHCAIS